MGTDEVGLAIIRRANRAHWRRERAFRTFRPTAARRTTLEFPLFAQLPSNLERQEEALCPTSISLMGGRVTFRAVEFFGCSGGMAEGFRRAGIEFSAVFDADPDACESYRRNLGTRPIRLDCRELWRLVELDVVRWPLDLLVADPPCTPWSRAGNRRGLADERDMLEVTAEFISAWRPTVWLIGNVPGLDDESNDSERRQVFGPLAKHYCIDFASLDAAAYGVPQHRKRPFWFGHPHGTPCLRWPTPTHGQSSRQVAIEGQELLPYVTVREALRHLSLKELGQPIRVREQKNRTGHPLSRADFPALTILAGQPNNCGNVLSTNAKHPISRSDRPSYTITCKGNGRGAQGACALSLSDNWPWESPSTTVMAGTSQLGQRKRSGTKGQSQSFNAVKLSERAAATLQGFPDGWQFVGKTKRSRWSQIGQAVPPAVAHAIGRSIVRWFACQMVGSE